MSKRRKFSTEFKRGAVEQASQPGVSCAQVARELGIRDALLTRWKREAQSRGLIADSFQWRLRLVVVRRFEGLHGFGQHFLVFVAHGT